MKTTLLQNIKIAATKLKGGKLMSLNTVKPVIEQIRKETLLTTQEEVILLVAILDRHCSDRHTDFEDLSNYFECSGLEIMEFVPAAKSLFSKGYITPNSNTEREITKMRFEVCFDVFTAIIEGKYINPLPLAQSTKFDQHDFSNSIHKLIEQRSDERISTSKLFSMAAKLEEEHTELSMIKELKEQISDINARVLFYKMCEDYSDDYDGGHSDLNSTLRDIYDRMGEGALVKQQIVAGVHPLISAELMFLKDKDELHLDEKGIQLLFGEVASAFLKSSDCVDKYAFVTKVEELVDDLPRNPANCDLLKLYRSVVKAENRNSHLTMITEVRKLLSNRSHRLLFYLVCKNLIDGSYYRVEELHEIFTKREELNIKRELKDEKHLLQILGLVELSNGSIFDGATIALTDKGKELFLEDDFDLFEEKVSGKDLIDCEKIVEKNLFFEPTLERQLSTLRESLQESNYSSLCRRLDDNKLPHGVAVLFYGLPGTGKTESAMQIARATGRSIMHVDISATKTCWFGESEKLIKAVFENYRRLCRKSKMKPILLFNEADAVFSKRKDSNSSNVAQTENAIQNIILEEMEKLDGILIATTNLADNLDKAFERRFLFKIRFDRPTIESKVNIWKDKLPQLNDVDAMRLALSYDFSGGEIDNIARKVTMEEVIEGVSPSMERLITICSEEKIGKSVKRVGF